MSFWRNLKIGIRLGAGIGLILVMLLIVAGAAYTGLSGGNEKFAEYRGMARQTSAAGAITSQLMMARLNVMKFLIYGTDQATEAVGKSIGDMTAETDKSIDLFKGSQEKEALIQGVMQSVGKYGTAFDQVKEFRTQRQTFFAKLNENGPKIEKNLSTIMTTAAKDGDPAAALATSEALRNLLIARVYVVKFLLDNKPEDAERVLTEMSAYNTAMTKVLAELQNPERRQLAERIHRACQGLCGCLRQHQDRHLRAQ